MIMERLKMFIDSQGITIKAFERSIGMSNASFGKSLKNGGNIGSDKVEIILQVYPQLNPSWLLTGEGSMILGEEPQPLSNNLNERILTFISHLGVNVAEFERNCNLSNGSVSKMGDNTRRSTLEKISKIYPSLNLNWLLTGEGSMILGEENAVQQKQESTESKGDFVRVKIHDDHVHYTYINRNHVYAVREEADRITVYMTNGDNYTIFEDFKRVLSDLLR